VTFIEVQVIELEQAIQVIYPLTFNLSTERGEGYVNRSRQQVFSHLQQGAGDSPPNLIPRKQ
jgi:hypothetical protein